MALNKAYTQYKENSIFTSSPQELTLMLYNGLVKFIMLAVQSIEEKDIKKAHDNFIRAQDIIVEFRTTLDLKYDIAKQLDSIYDYMCWRLTEANIHKDIEIANEVLGYARELRDAWAEAMKIAKSKSKSGRGTQVEQ